ncbi:MAG: hypothetical protein IJ928_04765 [Prevotella sp.]|nr:hypothetical protein [Prevotella sp.]
MAIYKPLNFSGLQTERKNGGFVKIFHQKIAGALSMSEGPLFFPVYGSISNSGVQALLMA